MRMHRCAGTFCTYVYICIHTNVFSHVDTPLCAHALQARISMISLMPAQMCRHVSIYMSVRMSEHMSRHVSKSMPCTHQCACLYTWEPPWTVAQRRGVEWSSQRSTAIPVAETCRCTCLHAYLCTYLYKYVVSLANNLCSYNDTIWWARHHCIQYRIDTYHTVVPSSEGKVRTCLYKAYTNV